MNTAQTQSCLEESEEEVILKCSYTYQLFKKLNCTVFSPHSNPVVHGKKPVKVDDKLTDINTVAMSGAIKETMEGVVQFSLQAQGRIPHVMPQS